MALFGTDPALLARLVRIERKLDAIMAHLEIGEETAAAGDGLDDARTLLEAGNVIGAIKAYRDATGAGLAEAKAAVDSGLPRT